MSLLKFTLARLALLFAAGAVLYAFGLREFWLVLWAFLISSVLSYVLLNRVRNEAAGSVDGFFSRMNQRIDENTRKEDSAEEQPESREDRPE